MSADRGQVVLLAAAVVVVAVVPMALAYHQLGYDDDVTRRAETAQDPTAVATHALQAGVDAADSRIAGQYPWNRRDAAAHAVRERLNESAADLRAHGAQSGVLYEVSENDSAATRWADDDCPSGPGRAFGPCVADGGLVLQERAGETTLLGAVLDLRVRSERRDSEFHVRIAVR